MLKTLQNHHLITENKNWKINTLMLLLIITMIYYNNNDNNNLINNNANYGIKIMFTINPLKQTI